jgi:hypothetical protein
LYWRFFAGRLEPLASSGAIHPTNREGKTRELNLAEFGCGLIHPPTEKEEDQRVGADSILPSV